MKRAQVVLAVAAVWIAVCGLVFSRVEHAGIITALYWAVATATTVGYGDVTPHDSVGRLLAIGVMLTTIPQLAAVFALITTSRLGGSLLSRIDRRLAEHHQSIHDRLDDIERKASPP